MNQIHDTTTTPSTLNGFVPEQMGATIQAIGEQPVLAKFQFRAKNEWISAGHNRTTITDFDGVCQRHEHPEPHVLECDEPAALHGGDAGANPAAVALHGLAGCLCSALVIHATARGIEILSVETTLSGDIDLHGLLGMDPAIRNGFAGIEVGMKVEANASEAQIDELIEIAKQRSPLFDLFSNPTAVEVRRTF